MQLLTQQIGQLKQRKTQQFNHQRENNPTRYMNPMDNFQRPPPSGRGGGQNIQNPNSNNFSARYNNSFNPQNFNQGQNFPRPYTNPPSNFVNRGNNFNNYQNQFGGNSFRGGRAQGRGRSYPNPQYAQSNNFSNNRFDQEPRQFPNPRNSMASNNFERNYNQFQRGSSPRNYSATFQANNREQQPRFDNRQNNREQQPRFDNRQNFPKPVINQRYMKSESNFIPNQYENNYRGRGRGVRGRGRGRGNFYQQPQQIEYQERGRGRGRGRGSYRSQRQNDDDIIDNQKVLTEKQKEDRLNKFINISSAPIRRNEDKVSSKVGQKNGRKKSSRQQSESVEQMPSEQQYESQQQNEQSEQYERQSIEEEQQSEEEQYQDQVQQQSIQESVEEQKAEQKQTRKRQRQRRGQKKTGGQESNKMCSRKQFDNRMQIFKENNNGKIKNLQGTIQSWQVADLNLQLDTSKSFSIFELNKSTYLPDEQLALKKFQRSANRGDQNEEEKEGYVPRNKSGLQKTMDHIKQYIVDADTKKAKQLPFPAKQKIQFIQIYVFLWDRMREMIKDITRLDEDIKHDKQIIQICEQITRFFILSINEGRKKYSNQLTFDDKMNKESLVKVMTPLLGLYANSKMRLNKLIKQMQQKNEEITVENIMGRMEQCGIYISPHEPEITSYAILFSEDFRKYLYQNIFVGLQLKDPNPLYESKQIQQVLAIKSALSVKNYSKYFEIVQSQSHEYLLSCLMVLGIDKIRRDICQNCQRVFKFMENQKLEKGVDHIYLRKLLNFKQNQNKEFKHFLSINKASINSSGYVVWNHNLSDNEQLYQPPEFPLDFKKNVKYFQQNEGQSKKRNIMDRRSIVERSWKKSTYVEQIISCFIKQEYSPTRVYQIVSQKSPSVKKRNENVVDLKEPQNEDKKQLQNDRKQMLNAKLEEIKRNKFLKNLSTKLIDLFKPDQTKQQSKLASVKRFANIFYKLKQKLILASFQKIQALAITMIQQQILLTKIHEYMSKKKSFINQFQVHKNEKPIEKASQKGMSELLKRPKQSFPGNENNMNASQQKIDSMNFDIVQKLCYSDIKTFVILIFNDVQPQEQNYLIIKRIMLNIFKLFLHRTAIETEILNFNHEHKDIAYIQGDKRIILSIRGLNGSPDDWEHFFGADSIIYLQTKQSSKNFVNALAKFIGIRNSLKKRIFFSIPISILKFGESTKYQKFQKIPINSDFQTLQFLKPSYFELSPSLKYGIIQFLNFSLNRFRKRPEIRVKSMGDLIKQISNTSEFALKQIKNYGANIGSTIFNSQFIFICFETYINMCLQSCIRLTKSYYVLAQLFPNWLRMMRKLCGNNQSKQINVTQVMKKHYKELEKLQDKLKIVSPYEVVEDKIILSNQDFINVYHSFVSQFDKTKQYTPAYIGTIVESLQLKNGVIEQSQIIPFYSKMLGFLEQALKQFYVIIPVDFKFFLTHQDLFAKVQAIMAKIYERTEKQKQRMKNNKFSQSQIFKAKSIQQQFSNKISVDLSESEQERENSLSRSKMSQFKYERAEWIKQVKKKLKPN